MGEYIPHPYVNSPRARSACVSGKRMSTAEATRVPSRHDESGCFRVVGAAVAWARPGAGEPPPIAFVKEHLNSTVVAAALLLTDAPTNRLMQLMLQKSVCD